MEAMNKQPIEHAHDPDLRCSSIALQRAALRARELAMRTQTAIVVSSDGKLEYLVPEAPPAEALHVQEASSHYGDKP